MALPDPSRSRAVLIGASRFRHAGLPDLPAVRNNLDSLTSCFRDTELWGLPPENCVVVPDPYSIGALVDPLHDASREAEDTLVVYYAGHGLLHARTLSLLLAVASTEPDRAHTSVAYEHVRDNLLESPAARKVLIMDCCFSGRALGGMADPTTIVADEASITGTYLLASAPPNKHAISPPDDTHTAFTGALVRLLTEGLPDGPELLSLDTIYRHVRGDLKRGLRPEPQRRADNTVGDLALVRNRSYLGSNTESPPAAKSEPRSSGGIGGADRPPRHPHIGRYRLGRVIGGSLLRPVRLATDVELNRIAVVKRLADEEPNQHRRLDPEQAATLQHPRIARVFDRVDVPTESGWAHFIATEYVEGRTLREVHADDPVDEFRAAEIVSYVCDALEYGHQNGALHGDLDDDNVMLTPDGDIKLLNFGLAYSPPLGWDRRRGRGGFDDFTYQVDIHAAGNLLHKLVGGDLRELDEFLWMALPPRPAPDISPELRRIISSAQAHDSRQTYRSASEMRDDLAQYTSRRH